MSDEIKNPEVVAVPEEKTVMADLIHDEDAPVMTVKKLLEAGVHFGHQTRRWNPKMHRYIYGARNGIYLIDLTKTVKCVNDAYVALKDICDKNGKVLFVGTKNSAQQTIIDEAVRSGSFYIAHRWLGGTLTNFRTILSRTKRLKELEMMEETGEFEKLPKKEVAILRKELEKLQRNLEGIKEMRALPKAIVVDDPTIEHNAVAEAAKLGIPVFGICDTSDDPDTVTYAIPSNNDGSNALKLLISVLADAVVESKGGIPATAYTKDEGEEATMKDAVRNADAVSEARRKAIREQRREREERYAKIQMERAARREAARLGAAGEAKTAEEKPDEEKPAEGDK